MNSAPQFAQQVSSKLEIPDMGIWPITARITNARLDHGDIVVDWDDQKSSHFLALWLREQCPCTICHSEITRETLIDITDIPVDIRATECRLDETGYLLVTWSDQAHASRYHPGWLRAHCYDDWARAERGTERATWDSGFSVPEFDAIDVLKQDETLYDWLTALDKHGLTRLRNVPLERAAWRSWRSGLGRSGVQISERFSRSSRNLMRIPTPIFPWSYRCIWTCQPASCRPGCSFCIALKMPRTAAKAVLPMPFMRRRFSKKKLPIFIG